MRIFCFMGLLLLVISCGPAKNNASATDTSLDQTLQLKNRVTISLLDRIRQKPGVIVRNGVPIINKTSNSLINSPTDISDFGGGSPEPLYVLNGYIVGNSFRDIDRMIDNTMVKEIIVLTGSDASEYGSRGAQGVIKITTE
ncbi:TonB-dependent Receptor Plug Domain [Muriicola jejuensis]|uniref:TonB-dependent receptor plug domain-containing protein n=1 Tax=Muriicola jejuensis TaxID=504488 RepID=A0A6P0U986_9FLAO|nr:TonB-dependent receptor plug domain-containing protein [Muriicola jejuensis]NER09724.1 TonB-dependent receptor plug domain-containing protein [Muriicola jejuensis]SMP06264.1 TonB-dependent Receptor Plug Domain [Muriicola jejuensis]